MIYPRFPTVCRRCNAAPPEPQDGFCGVCLVVRAAESQRAQNALDDALRLQRAQARGDVPWTVEPPPLPGVRVKRPRKPPRRCCRCQGPGGLRYMAGLCGACRDDAYRARLRERGQHVNGDERDPGYN